MAVLEIVKYGTPVLREKAKPVHKITPKIQRLVADMFDTMMAANGVGLAAPQVGESLRIFILNCTTEEEGPLPNMVFIDPVIVKKEGAMVSWEGCLSFPEVFVDVKRYESITVKAKDAKGRTFTLNPKPGTLLNRAIQHEMDHLDGILFIDHVIDRLGAEEALKLQNLPPIDPSKMIEDTYIDGQLALME
jgi:peptide deformylase